MTESKVSRRNYVKYAGAGIVVVAGAAAGAYYMSQPSQPPTATETQSPTTTQKEVTLDVAHINYPYFHRALEIALPRLQEMHPELKISLTESEQEYSAYRRYLITRMAAGDAPDLMWNDHIWMGEFVDSGFLEPLPDVWARPEGPVPDLLPMFKEALTWDNKLYGIWWDTDTRLFVYSKKHIPNPPTNWDETIELQKTLKAEGKPPMVFYAAYGWDDTVNSAMYMNIPVDELQSPGWGFFKVEDGKRIPIFNGAAGLKAFEYLIKLRDAGATASYDKPEEIDSAFLNGEYSAEVGGGTWIYSIAKDSGWAFDRYENEVGYVVQPYPTGGHTASYGGGFVMTIPTGSKEKDLAKELLLILLSPEIEAQMGKEYGALFTRKNVLDQLIKDKAVPHADAIAQQLEYTIPRPLIPEWDRVHRYWIDALQEALLGKKPPQEALDDAAEKVAIVLGG